MVRRELRSFLFGIHALAFVCLGLGCGESEGQGGEKPSIVSFSADSEVLEEGEATTLRWSTKGARAILLSANGYRVVTEDLPTSGEWIVKPSRDTRYRLEAVGPSGVSTMEELVVQVTPFGAPRIESFEASSSVVPVGHSVELFWKVRGAEIVEISEEGGRILGRSGEGEGSREVVLQRATTYHLRAFNEYGTSSAEVSVEIGWAPIVSLRWEESVLDFEADARLEWEVDRATSIEILDPLGELLHAAPGESGSLSIQAKRPGTYRAVAEGPGGVATAEANLVVRPVVDTFSAEVSIHRPGAPALVSWTVRGAERIEISNGERFRTTVSEASGSLSVPVGAGGIFQLRAITGSVSVESTAQLGSSELPLIRELRAGTLVTAGNGMVGVSSVAWEVDGASKVLVWVEPGGYVDTSNANPRKDEVPIVLQAPGIIRLEATNNAGTSVREIPAPVDPVPTIAEFFAAPSRAGLGERVEIHWKTLHAQRVILEREGVSQGVDPASVNGSHPSEAVSETTTFLLRAYNGLDHEVISEPLVVEVGPPKNLSFQTGDGRSFYAIGTKLPVVWENDGGSRLTVVDRHAGREVCEITDPLQIRSGGCIIQLPDQDMELIYDLVVTNASGTDTRSLQVAAVTGPIILSFEVEKEEMTVGDSLKFSWVVSPDHEGELPTLSLTDDLGNNYPLTEADPLEDDWRFRIQHAGERTFKLTASTSNPPDYVLEKKVRVWAIPTIETLSAAPDFAEEEGDPIEISWTSVDDPDSVEIYLLDRFTGEVVGAPVFVSNDAEMAASGRAVVHPTIAQPSVRLVVKNPLGVPTSRDLRIGVNPATVLAFDASETSVLAGESVTITWDTARATDVIIEEEYISIENDPGTTHITSITGWTSMGTVSFPSGFSFPHDGESYSQARVAPQGWVSFNLNASYNYSVQQLPASGGRMLDLIPFWADLVPSMGRVHWNYYEEPLPHVIVEWRNNAHFSYSSDFSFQVAMYETGEFEYRYGLMDGLTNPFTRFIGAQDFEGTSARTLLYGSAAVPSGGLEARSYFFDGWDGFDAARSTPRPTPASGSWTFTPFRSRTYTLKVWNGHSEDEAEIRIEVHPKGKLQAWAEPAEPLPNEPFTIHWVGENLSWLVVEDGSGQVVHTAGPGGLASGSFHVAGLPMGDHTYTIRAVGKVSWDQLAEEVEVHVYEPYSIDSFTASDTLLDPADPPLPVTLSWTATNLTSAWIHDEATGQDHPIDPGDLASGSMVFHPERTTTYTLHGESYGRPVEVSLEIVVRSVRIDAFIASATSISAGGSIDLSWSTSGDGVVTLQGPGLPPGPFVEVSDVPFEDISAVGVTILPDWAAEPDALVLVDFPTDFAFPYFGEEYSQVVVSGVGYLSFNPSVSGYKWDYTILPNVQEPDVHLAVFWADLDVAYISGQGIYGVFVPGPDPHVIIQWKHWSSFWASGDMNFQVVLYESGAVEYRYGVMYTGDATAEGGYATIGLQAPGGAVGSLLHHSVSSSNTFPGGFVNRSWRWNPAIEVPGDSSTQVSPTKSGNYTLCIDDGFYEECETIWVEVLP